MKKPVTSVQPVCDFCSSTSYAYEFCIFCNRDVCGSCQDKIGRVYHPTAFSRGYGDIWICSDCLPTHQDEPIVQAYAKVEELAKTYEAFREKWEKDHKDAWEQAEQLYKTVESKRRVV